MIKAIKLFLIKTKCVIEDACNGKVLFVGKRCVNVYTIDINSTLTHDKCLSALHDDSWLWRRRLVENLKIMHLKVFALILALNNNFHHQGLHNKMV